MITKEVLSQEELYIQFSGEELEELNIKEGDKFSVEVEDDKMILKPFGTLEIDLADFDRETLEFIIARSCEKDISVNQVFNDLLEEILDREEIETETTTNE
jgi:bifunctional DNA-binding transcriptional regulator/antitoxin component of YhaV-PrlF toxin-antitoxin module